MTRFLSIVTAVTAAIIGCKDSSAGPSSPPAKDDGLIRFSSTFELVPRIAFTSTQAYPPSTDRSVTFNSGEIYLVDPNGENLQRLTANFDGDGFATLSSDGKKISFDSNRLRADGPLNTSDLFVMSSDGSDEQWLIRGASSTWSPDSKWIAFHRSASGTALPIKPDPGAATFDSDIFILNVDDRLEYGEAALPTNITNNPLTIDDDPDWSPMGRKILYTSHSASLTDHNNVPSAEIYMIDFDGAGEPERITDNVEEERAPSWSPDGARIAFMCRRGGNDFEICVMNLDRTGQLQLTNNTLPEATPSWSPDVDNPQIVFQRTVNGRFQLYMINADGTGERRLTNNLEDLNGFPNWGVLRVHVPD